jgi:hypothetical protein
MFALFSEMMKAVLLHPKMTTPIEAFSWNGAYAMAISIGSALIQPIE